MGDLKIEVVEPPTRKTYCGGAESQVRWWVVGRKSGWILQHITRANNVTDCAREHRLTETNTVPHETPFEGEFWEAWQVVRGRVFIGDTGKRDEVSDTFRVEDWGGNTRGNQKVVGEAKFFENYNFKKPPWGHDPRLPAGSLPTMRTAPPGWDATGSDAHTLEAEWVCCPKDYKATKVTGAPSPSAKEKTGTESPVKNVLNVLKQLPAWTRLGADRRGRYRVAELLMPLLRERAENVRAAMKIYIRDLSKTSQLNDIDGMSRLFVLNRYYFDVPSTISLEKIRSFGGWDCVPSDEKSLNPLWPWSIRRGKKFLTGTFGGYFGPIYLALDEFDFFRKSFSRYDAPKPADEPVRRRRGK
jgi:hypothetical protein